MWNFLVDSNVGPFNCAVKEIRRQLNVMEALCVTSNVSHQVNLIVQSLLVTTFK